MVVLSPANSKASAVPEWLIYLFIVLGLMAVPLGIYQIIQRGRVRARAKRAQRRRCGFYLRCPITGTAMLVLLLLPLPPPPTTTTLLSPP